MKLPLLVLALSIITSNSLPLTINGQKIQFNNELKLAYTDADRAKLTGFHDMENGDLSLDGIGSVSQELDDYGYDSFMMNAGLTLANPGGLMFAETNQGKLYIYAYDSQARISFDKVSISFNSTTDKKGNLIPDTSNSFVEKDIKLVSVSSNFRLTKWEVLDFKGDMSKPHIYTGRELIDIDKKDSMDGILPCTVQYTYDSASNATKQDITDYITITDKVVAWQSIQQDRFRGNFTSVDTGGSYPDYYPDLEDNNLIDKAKFKQIHYVAFNTDNDPNMEKLEKIEIQYKAQHFYGKSTIGGKSNPQNNVNEVTEKNFQDVFNEGEKHIVDITTPLNENESVNGLVHTAIIEASDEETTYTFDNGLVFGNKKYEWKFKPLSTVEEIKEMNPAEIVLPNKDTDNKKWFVNFLTNDYIIGVPMEIVTSYGDSGIDAPTFNVKYVDGFNYYFGLNKNEVTWDSYKNNQGGIRFDFTNNYQYDISQSPIDITDLTIVRLWYLQDGDIKEAIVVDTYTNSKGTSNILDSHVLTPEELLQMIADWFNKIFDWIKNNWQWLVAVLVIVICIPLIVALCAFVPQIFSLIKYIGKALLWIITAPFKLIIWLFKKPDR